MPEWGVITDIIGDGVSEQEEIMTAICETKGATFDGTDCVGELDDSTVHVRTKQPTILTVGDPAILLPLAILSIYSVEHVVLVVSKVFIALLISRAPTTYWTITAPQRGCSQILAMKSDPE